LFDPKKHFNVHKMAKLELPNHFGSVQKSYKHPYQAR
jgi:hypothetical protein